MRLLISAVVAVFRVLPGGLAWRLGATLGGLARLVGFRRRIVRSQLRGTLGRDLSPADFEHLVAEHYRHLGLLLVELLRLPGATPSEVAAQVDFQGLQHIEAAREQGKGVILVTGHLGNWELLALRAVHLEVPLHGVGKRVRGRSGEIFRSMIREGNGIKAIPARNSARNILKALRANDVVAFLVDQNMTRDDGIFVDFLGVPACTTPGPVVMAERSGAVILTGHGWRDPENPRLHHCRMDPPFELEKVSDDPAENQRHNTQRLNAVIEGYLREQPAQWLWLHKRWKTRPEEADPPPFDYG